MPPRTQASAIPLLKPTKSPKVLQETKPRFKSVALVSLRSKAAKQLPQEIKPGPQTWSLAVTPGDLQVTKATSNVTVDAAIFAADKVDSDFAIFSEGRGQLFFLVKGLKAGNAFVIAHSFFFQPPGLIAAPVSVTVEADDATVTIDGISSDFPDFAAVLIAKSSTAMVKVTTDWPAKWFWSETVFATVKG